MVNSMTEGKPLKLILKFLFPIFISSVVQQLYSMVDTVVVGRTLGELAFGGVGATGSLSFLIFGFVQGLTSGFAIVTSQLFGKSDESGVKRSVAAAFVLCVALTAILTAVSCVCAMPLLRLMNTPDSIIGYAYDYIITLFIGMFATVFYNILASILRAVGDSRTPLLFLIITSVLNVGLDFLFILVFKMGVAGAGWATVVSQVISGIACLIYMLIKCPMLRISAKDFKGIGRVAGMELWIGIPMALQCSITAIGIMAQQTAINGFGDVAVAAYSAAVRIDGFVNPLFSSLGTAMATYAGQNYGAGRYDRIRQGVRAGLLIALICSAVGLAFVLAFNGLLLKLFIKSPTDEMLYYSKTYIVFQAAFYFICGTVNLYRSTLQGTGCSALASIAGVLEAAMRFIAALLFVKWWGYLGVCASTPSAWLAATIYLVIAYYVIIYRRMRTKSADKTPETHETGA